MNCGTTRSHSGIMAARFLGEPRHEKSFRRIHWHICLSLYRLRNNCGGWNGHRARLPSELAIALAFGLSIIAMAYGIGQISGCHVNPAVSFGVYIAGRMTLGELFTYWVAQIAGAIAAALVLYLILLGKTSGWNGALGQTTWSEYSTLSAFIFEIIGTFLFLVCILGVTQRGAPVELAGIAIGLTLVAIHLVGINISGSSLNPARSLGPALVGFAHNPEALKQIWLYILTPLIGAGTAGYLFRSGVLAAETVIPIRGEGGSDIPPAASAPRDSKPRRR